MSQQLLVQRLRARASELEVFLALLVVRHGYPMDSGFRYDLSDESAHTLRAQLPSAMPSCVVSYDTLLEIHVIDAV